MLQSSSAGEGMRTPDMANLDSEVQLFISKLSHIGDTRIFATAFEELVRKFNCKFFVISGIAEERNAQQEMLVIHNLPELWVTEYLDNNYFLNDPIARHCIDARNPFLWKEAIEASASREAKEIMVRAEKYGLKN
jgi:Autoinducer binding domain